MTTIKKDDKVLIIQKYTQDTCFFYWNPKMDKCIGKVYTVSHVDYRRNRIFIRCHPYNWAFLPESCKKCVEVGKQLEFNFMTGKQNDG